MKVFLAFPENLLGKLILKTIHLLPEVDVVHLFSSPGGAFNSALLTDFDMALIYADSLEYRISGFGLLRRLRECAPQTKCVMMFDKVTKEMATRAFSMGARGVLSVATSDVNQLCQCIAKVNAGQIWANAVQVGWLIEELSSLPNGNSEICLGQSRLGETVLSTREAEVVRLLARGNTNRKIARTLNLSEHTVKNYLSRIFQKTGVSSRTELMAQAMKGMIEESAARNQSFSNMPVAPPLLFKRLSRSVALHEEPDSEDQQEKLVQFRGPAARRDESAM